MGLNVILEDETGKPLASLDDSRGTLSELLPAGDPDFPLLRWVDPYGDTVFNRRQAEALLEELARLQRPDLGAREAAALARLRKLAEHCAREPHLYLRFRGD